MSLRVLIVEDEPIARRRLRDLVAARDDLELVGESGSRAEAVAAVRAHQPDLLFLDIRLPDGDAFDLLDELGADAGAAVVFVTAHDRFALEAFEVHALDYLLKPFDDERFDACVDRVVDLLGRQRPEIGELADLLRREIGGDDFPSRLAIRGTGRTLFVDTEEIRWVEAADYCCRLHLSTGSQLMRATLKELEKRLDPAHFARVHRSAIVALAHVRELRPTFRGDAVAVLDDGTRIPVSRRYRRQVESRLAG